MNASINPCQILLCCLQRELQQALGIARTNLLLVGFRQGCGFDKGRDHYGPLRFLLSGSLGNPSRRHPFEHARLSLLNKGGYFFLERRVIALIIGHASLLDFLQMPVCPGRERILYD